MRKRKRGYGSYLDEETGEVTTVQTTKQAKRAHQKTGKWYKEPTAKELRIWERESKQKEAAEKALKREENKKKNAEKRAEKEAKELELKQQQFQASKITFTQTLAKKDEDQLNLHSWFGGKPQKQKPPQSLSHAAKETSENKEIESQCQLEVSGEIHAAHRSHNLNLRQKLSQSPSKDGQTNSQSFSLPKPSSLPCDSKEKMPELIDDKDQSLMAFEQDQDANQSLSFEDFDIAEDFDAGPNDCDAEWQRSKSADVSGYEFRVPTLPAQQNRLPLSPMSKSDVNIRNSQTQNVGDFKKQLEASGLPSLSTTNVVNLSSTQMVKDLLSGLCTQDFNDDDDDDIDEHYYDKENQQPATATDAEKGLNKAMKRLPLESEIPPSKLPVKDRRNAGTFPPLTDSFDGHDYDNIFAELGNTINDVCADNKDDDFDDGGLDDDTLLSLPATQILISTARTKSCPQQASPKATTTSFDTNTEIHQTHVKASNIARNCDSFAIDGLSDADLLQGLKEYEQSQQASITRKQKRTLPWESEGWTAATTGGQSQAIAADFSEWSQKTELLPSQSQ